MEELKEQLKKSEIKNCILEEENALLRESIEAMLAEIEATRKEQEEIIKLKDHCDKIMSGKIYKILKKAKNMTRGKN